VKTHGWFGASWAAMSKPRRYVLAGCAIGAFGFGWALLFGHRLTVGFCGVVWGMTLTLAVLTWRESRGKP
jgi:hypothetical protein